MADDQQELRRINWSELFSFTHVFKSFRMAIHPSKIALALAAIVLVLVFGTVLDFFWGLGGGTAVQGEIFGHFCTPSGDFNRALADREKALPRQALGLMTTEFNERYSLGQYLGKVNSGTYQSVLRELNDKDKPEKMPTLEDQKEEDLEKNMSKNLGKANDYFDEEVSRARSLLGKAYDAAEKRIKDDGALKDKQKDEAYEQLDKDYAAAKRALTLRRLEFKQQVDQIEGRGIFASLSEYQWTCVGNALKAARYGNVLGGLADFRAKRAGAEIPPAALGPAQGVQNVAGPVPVNDQAGFVYWMLLAVYALVWLICQHWVYATIFLVFCLAVVALFGGAIHRIAAVQFAREEKISIVQALKFSLGKFLSFFTAPLIPLVIILGFGVALFLGGLIGSIPWIGEILMAILFFLAIILGMGVAFVSIGLIAGGGLMYPTIAVEGSDSFDAISRSFSYVFARPWRAAVYGLAALMYGVITYLFVRLFVFLALASAHYFVGWGVFGQGGPLGPGADKLDILWTAPTFDALFGRFSWSAMNGTEMIAAVIIGFWVFLLAASVAAYLLSYAASSTTVIYYLLRQKVDATDLDDVYIEESESAPAPAGEAAPAPAAEGEGQKPPEKA